MELSIHHYIGCGKQWFVTCREIGLDRYPLKFEEASDAKEEAILVARKKMDELEAKFSKLVARYI